jgi:thiol-disulfide isomerase/thioredoxin
MPRTSLTTLAAALLLAALPAAAPASAEPSAEPSSAPRSCPATGSPAPEFSFPVPKASNERVSLRSLKAKGKPIVLAFWAFSCAPCIQEMPALQRLAAEWGERVSVLLVHVGGPEEKMLAALDRWSIGLPSALDESKKKSTEQYCAGELPRLFVVDAKGTVQAAFGALGEGFEGTVRGAVERVGR